MALVESGECKIEFLNSNGLGESKTPLMNKKITIPYTLENEIVEFEHHIYRSESNTILKKIITPSVNRIKPQCEYFGACGGCMLQHLKEETYINFKLGIISEALSKHSLSTKVNPIIQSSSFSRRRATLEAIKKNDKLFIGFHRLNSNQIININHCMVLRPELSNLLDPLKTLLFNVMLDKQKADISVTMATNGIDMLIESDNILNNENELIDFAKKYLTRLQISNKKEISNLYIKEIPYVIFGDTKVGIDPKCFLQATEDSDKIISKLAMKYLTSENINDNLVDLFCGRGTITIPLSKTFKIDAFESDKNSIKALSTSSKNITTYMRDLYKNPLTQNELLKYRYASINPPRLGAKKQCTELAKSTVEKILYISCNPTSFARDAKILSTKYELKEISPMDQFLYSPHIEIIALFELKS